MKITCPLCKNPIPTEQVNIAQDIGFCPSCDEAFKISDSFEPKKEVVNEAILEEAPKGAWVRTSAREIIIGATTRSAAAFFLVPFMLVWSGGSLGGIYGSQIASGEFDLLMSLFGLPFLIGSIIFWALALMAINGKVEVSIGHESKVFVGIGSLGWTRRFDWGSITTIHEDISGVNYPGGYNRAIVLEGKGRIKFGSNLTSERQYFVVNALKYTLKNTRN